ncbi:MAG: hypothetical protein WAV20_19110 [Blastocatellia bacterium]
MNNKATGRSRVGVIFGPVDDLNVVAAGYLILHLNTLQHAIEFELVPSPPDNLLWPLLSRKVVSRSEVEAAGIEFRDQYHEYWQRLLARSIASETPPSYLIVVSLARFADNLYSTTLHDVNVAILALGNWERYMAPPSLVEFITFLVFRLAIGLIDPRMRKWQHLGTKGCLWDYNPRLSEVRYKVLVGYTCDDCLENIRAGPLTSLAENLGEIMSKGWLWKKDDPQAPAAIAAKLGYDLFSTKGPRPNWRESLLDVVRQEGVKELLKWVSALILAAVLVWLNLKKP